MKFKSIATILFSLIIFALFIYSIYWLWQRQPKGSLTESKPVQNNQIQKPQDEKSNIKSNLTPEDFSVITSAKNIFSGTVEPNSLIVIYSNNKQYTTKSDDKGKFQQEVTLTAGLNLYSIQTYSQNLDELDKKTLSLYFAKDKETTGNTVYAGSVKSIFNNLITVTTSNGDRSISSQKSTDYIFPKNSEDSTEATASAITNVRVGDYMIALGNRDETDKIAAQKITIIRENKPQNSETVNAVKLLTAPRQNLFSAKNIKDDKILEFTLKKESKIESNNQTIKSIDITKDKRAIIVSYADKGDQIVDLISILP